MGCQPTSEIPADAIGGPIAGAITQRLCAKKRGSEEPAATDEDEDIEPRTFALAEAREMVRRGEIVDMKTVAGLALI
jgi:hypothetical protein